MTTHNTTAKQGLFDTAKLGTISLILVIAGIILSFTPLQPVVGLTGLISIVLAIMSLVKKERPKWPAIVSLVLNFFTAILIVILVVIVGVGIALL